jgi:hypothetical protein
VSVSREHPLAESDDHVIAVRRRELDRLRVVRNLIGIAIDDVHHPARADGQHRLAVVEVARVLVGRTDVRAILGVEESGKIDREAMAEVQAPLTGCSDRVA